MCLETKSDYKKEFKLIKKVLIKGGTRNISVNKIIKLLEEFYEIHKSLGNNIKKPYNILGQLNQ